MKYVALLPFLLCIAVPALAADIEYGAGYTWAGQNGVIDPAQCEGNSPRFVEGCRAAAQKLNPAHIAPAAGGDDNNATDPSVTDDPFIEDPFRKDPFAPEALPVPGGSPFSP